MTERRSSRLLRDSRWISVQIERWANGAMEPTGLTAAQVSLLLHILAQGEEGTWLTAIHRSSGYSMPTLLLSYAGVYAAPVFLIIGAAYSVGIAPAK